MSINIEDARTIVFELTAMALSREERITEETYENVMLRRRELLNFIDHQERMLHGRLNPFLDDPHP
jgi:hypothetical protein